MNDSLDEEPEAVRCLPRAASHMPPRTFVELFDLITSAEWLEPKMDSLLALWNLCDNDDQQQLLRDLFRNFTYMDGASLGNAVKGMVDHFLGEWELKPEKTIIVATAGGTDADGSQLLLQYLKSAFPATLGWDEGCFVNTIGSGPHKAENDGAVVLVDDFVGTGKTAKRKTEWLMKRLRELRKTECSVRFASLAAMRDARDLLDAMEVEYFSTMWLQKGISHNYEGKKLEAYILAMAALEDKLATEWKGKPLATYHFGYERSEALYALHACNTPNNVFPIFWWPKLRREPHRATMLQRLSP
ncbi:MAG: hypothetical protein HQ559_15675 [Lentisphaerae bacterium]|nr:hypothetical protein [Lentisphaerota bacterium]